jgi:hypothetical protein
MRVTPKALLLLCAVLFISAPVAAITVSGVEVSGISFSSATIRWKTDVAGDGAVHFGTDPRFGIVRDPIFTRKEHEITIDNLDPSTTYYLQAVSTDAEGNRSAHAGVSFKTLAKSGAQPKPEKSVEDLDEEELLKLKEQVDQQIQDVVRPPSIVGPPKVTPGATTAEISWKTDRESSSQVFFVRESEYSAGAANPYRSTQGNANDSSIDHKVTITGLEPSTVYHFAVSSEDAAGLEGKSEDDTFRTKSQLPEIKSARVTRVQEHSALISWESAVKAKGLVEYTNTRTKVVKIAGNPVFATAQKIQLNDLEFGSRYSAIIRAVNEAGDEVQSKPLSFVTVRDREAPVISKVNNESTLYPGEEVKIQTVIAWETDEPTSCQVFYAQGLASEGEGDALPPETGYSITHTQVIIGLASATVYRFWMICADEAKNESRSEDFVLITPVKEKSIIDIILENFEGTFGWLKNIGG